MESRQLMVAQLPSGHTHTRQATLPTGPVSLLDMQLYGRCITTRKSSKLPYNYKVLSGTKIFITLFFVGHFVDFPV